MPVSTDAANVEIMLGSGSNLLMGGIPCPTAHGNYAAGNNRVQITVLTDAAGPTLLPGPSSLLPSFLHLSSVVSATPSLLSTRLLDLFLPSSVPTSPVVPSYFLFPGYMAALFLHSLRECCPCLWWARAEFCVCRASVLFLTSMGPLRLISLANGLIPRSGR